MEFLPITVVKIDTLLTGFLRFSRLGRAALTIKRLDMNAMLSNIAQTVEFQIKQAGVTFRVEPLPNCREDAVQVNQVFSNLIDNAIKYRSPNHPGLIQVSGKVENGRCTYAVNPGIIEQAGCKGAQVSRRGWAPPFLSKREGKRAPCFSAGVFRNRAPCQKIR